MGCRIPACMARAVEVLVGRRKAPSRVDPVEGVGVKAVRSDTSIGTRLYGGDFLADLLGALGLLHD